MGHRAEGFLNVIATLIAVSIPAGLVMESRFPIAGSSVVSLWIWALYGALIHRSPPRDRPALLLCLIYAALGELFLSSWWRFYVYRHGSVPLFVPPGHVLLYWLGIRFSPRLPSRFLVAPLLFAPVVLLATRRGDLHGAFWFAVYLCFVLLSKDRKLYVGMFFVALALEFLGTAGGTWRWAAHDPWMGLASANPPLGAGVFYCVLDQLVNSTLGLFRRWNGARVSTAPEGVPT